MEKPTLRINTRRLKYALTTLALFAALVALPAYAQTSSGETNPQPPAPPSWSFQEDVDQDGMKDLDELLQGMDPVDAEDGLSDFDGDDLSLAWEFAIGTNPDEADIDLYKGFDRAAADLISTDADVILLNY